MPGIQPEASDPNQAAGCPVERGSDGKVSVCLLALVRDELPASVQAHKDRGTSGSPYGDTWGRIDLIFKAKSVMRISPMSALE